MPSFANYSPNAHFPILAKDQDTGQTETSSDKMTSQGEYHCTDKAQ